MVLMKTLLFLLMFLFLVPVTVILEHLSSLTLLSMSSEHFRKGDMEHLLLPSPLCLSLPRVLDRKITSKEPHGYHAPILLTDDLLHASLILPLTRIFFTALGLLELPLKNQKFTSQEPDDYPIPILFMSYKETPKPHTKPAANTQTLRTNSFDSNN
jgi:hypothetical protein